MTMASVIVGVVVGAALVLFFVTLRSNRSLRWDPEGIEGHGKSGITLGPPGGAFRHTDILCPTTVWRGSSRFPLVFRLTTAPSDGSVSSTVVAVSDGETVHVRIDAPGFVVLSASEQDLVVPAGADSVPIVFYLRPGAVGRSTVTLHLSLHGNPIGVASFAVAVVEDERPMSLSSQPVATVALSPGAPPPDFVLHIGFDHVSRRPELRFVLVDLSAGELGIHFAPVPILGDPQTFASSLYRELTNLAPGMSTEAAHRRLVAEGLDRRLKELGQRLWKDLIPSELKRIYWEKSFAGRSIIVMSDEPHIPWELVWPYSTANNEFSEDTGPWCLTMRFARWLTQNDSGYGNAQPLHRLNVAAMAVVSPPDARLPGAAKEKEYLDGFCRDAKVRDLSLGESSYPSVARILETADYDLLHVAAHGRFDASRPDAPAALVLTDGDTLDAKAIVGRVEHQVRKRRPAFILNACEIGRADWGLTQIGGWASSLVGAGASLFLGPMWSVDDEVARIFSETLYTGLRRGVPVGEAVRKARLVAGGAAIGGSSHLAYSLYAHPNATVTFGSAGVSSRT
jgi:hypothetical protein